MLPNNYSNLPEIKTVGKDKLNGDEFNTHIFRLIARQIDGIAVDGYLINYVLKARPNASEKERTFEVVATDEAGQQHMFAYNASTASEVIHSLVEPSQF